MITETQKHHDHTQNQDANNHIKLLQRLKVTEKKTNKRGQMSTEDFKHKEILIKKHTETHKMATKRYKTIAKGHKINPLQTVFCVSLDVCLASVLEVWGVCYCSQEPIVGPIGAALKKKIEHWLQIVLEKKD